MRSLGVDVVEYNIDKDKNAREELVKKTGRTAIPVIDIEGTVLSGFNPEAIVAALDKNVR